ncbi:MAG: dihydroorotate dehydrogenase [Actinomycetota bacterium]|nr:dihydroorotate dehydrogenase [Actinomycetota bacterium]
MRILNASGCLDAVAAPEVAQSLDAFVTKTVTPLPRAGNDPVRIAETDVGMLNSIGLANPGIDAFLCQTLPELGALGVPVWVSVGGFDVADYVDLCDRLDDRSEVTAIELNVSCPNVDDAPSEVGEIVTAARAATRKPIYAKLSPATADVTEVARAAQAAGADGLSLVNTVRGLSLDERTLRPTLGRAVGGLSGPALKPIALAAVYACYEATRMPIVGMGGIATGRDALEFLAAGASDLALGTILFADPYAPSRIREEFAVELAALGVADEDNAVGLAHERIEEIHLDLNRSSTVGSA